MALTFVTSNQYKAAYLARMLGLPVEHQHIDLNEIQSLDPHTVIKHKAHAAYKVIGAPVLVEDISLVFHSMGKLPGTLIRWFLEELGEAGLAILASRLDSQAATASIIYGLYDGSALLTFEGHTQGHIIPVPRGKGPGFNDIFVPEGSHKTYTEMSERERDRVSHRTKAIQPLHAYLQQHPELIA
jgi:non-canonical purine NTP pyrophosphatase (RdgB/HAM1 family)